MTGKRRTRRSLSRGKRLALLLGVTALLLLGVGGITPASALWSDCKIAPEPSSPGGGMVGMLTPRPDPLVTGDPFDGTGNTGIADVYGYTYNYAGYDIGCADVWTQVQIDLASDLVAFPAGVRAFVHFMYREVLSPSWDDAWAPTLGKATEAVDSAVRGPLLPVMVLLVALLMLWHARTGNLAKLTTAAIWALAMLALGAAAASYPHKSAEAVDQLLTAAVTDTSRAFGKASPNIHVAEGAPDEAVVSKQLDALNRETLYRAWLQGMFRDPDSATARDFGPRMFRVMHLTWAEGDAVKNDPDGEGKRILDDRKRAFKALASELQNAGPRVYDQFTGNHGRWGATMYAISTSLTIDVLIAVALVFVLIASMAIRLTVPLLPALTTLALLDVTADYMRRFLGSVAGLIIRGPLMFLAAMLNMVVVLHVLHAPVAAPLGYTVAAVTALVLWRLLKPLAEVRSATRSAGTWTRRGVATAVRATALTTSIVRASGRSDSEPRARWTAGSPVNGSSPPLGPRVHHHAMDDRHGERLPVASTAEAR